MKVFLLLTAVLTVGALAQDPTQSPPISMGKVAQPVVGLVAVTEAPPQVMGLPALTEAPPVSVGKIAPPEVVGMPALDVCKDVQCPDVCANPVEKRTAEQTDCCKNVCAPDCSTVRCAAANCTFGQVAYTPAGSCCQQCKLDCSTVKCMMVQCPGAIAVTPEGGCCPQCPTTKPDCTLVDCEKPECGENVTPVTPDGACCPECPALPPPPPPPPKCDRSKCAEAKCTGNIVPYVPEGDCCPVCPDCSQTMCTAQACVGATWAPGACCQTCPKTTDKCANILCNVPACADGATPVTADGECCPKCPTTTTPAPKPVNPCANHTCTSPNDVAHYCAPTGNMDGVVRIGRDAEQWSAPECQCAPATCQPECRACALGMIKDSNGCNTCKMPPTTCEPKCAAGEECKMNPPPPCAAPPEPAPVGYCATTYSCHAGECATEKAGKCADGYSMQCCAPLRGKRISIDGANTLDCSTCRCTKNNCPAVCSPLALNCENGYAKDDQGCEIAKCANATTTDPCTACTKTQTCRDGKCVDVTTTPKECAGVDCGAGKTCVADPKECITTPCPQYRCEDDKVSCPMVQCANALPCKNGYAVDDKGCQTCACKADDPPKCEPVLCKMACKNGWAKDDAGCDMCACKPDDSPKCPEMMCTMACTNGYVKNADGCDTCTCKPDEPPKCPAVTCKMACNYGWVKDAAGCDTCACADPCDGKDCAKGSYCAVEQPQCVTTPCLARAVCKNPCDEKKCGAGETCRTEEVQCVRAPCPPVAVCDKPQCPKAQCEMACPNGFAVDATGCEICKCKECPQVRCSQACLFGFAKDANTGCQSCECAEPVKPVCPMVATSPIEGSCSSLKCTSPATAVSSYDSAGCPQCRCECLARLAPTTDKLCREVNYIKAPETGAGCYRYECKIEEPLPPVCKLPPVSTTDKTEKRMTIACLPVIGADGTVVGSNEAPIDVVVDGPTSRHDVVPADAYVHKDTPTVTVEAEITEVTTISAKQPVAKPSGDIDEVELATIDVDPATDVSGKRERDGVAVTEKLSSCVTRVTPSEAREVYDVDGSTGSTVDLASASAVDIELVCNGEKVIDDTFDGPVRPTLCMKLRQSRENVECNKLVDWVKKRDPAGGNDRLVPGSPDIVAGKPGYCCVRMRSFSEHVLGELVAPIETNTDAGAVHTASLSVAALLVAALAALLV